jgi:uncharacterized protein
VFIREIVPRQAIALAARFCYNEPYIALPMRHSIDVERAEKGEKGRVRYEWLHQGQWAHLEVETEGSQTSPGPGSEQEFISEHYWGYTAQRDGSCLEYHVAHMPWRVWAVRQASLHCDIEQLYGASFARFFGAGPCSAFLADGSEVAVYRGRRLPYNDGPAVDTNTEALLRRPDHSQRPSSGAGLEREAACGSDGAARLRAPGRVRSTDGDSRLER